MFSKTLTNYVVGSGTVDFNVVTLGLKGWHLARRPTAVSHAVHFDEFGLKKAQRDRDVNGGYS